MAEQATQQGIEMTLADGSVIKAANSEEALKIAAKMKEDTSASLKEEKSKREALETQVASLTAQFEESRKPAPKEGSFDNERYWKLMNQDPVAAQNYLDGHRFGIPPEQVAPRFNQMQTQLDQFRGEALASQFLTQHYEDFPATQESAKSLRTRVEQLQNAGYPVTVETMNIAYGQLVEEGAIKPLEKEEQKREEPNPSARGAGASIPDSEINKAEGMSDKDLEAFLKSKGMIA